MEAKEVTVIYAPKTRTSITYIAAYIEEKGYPDTAIRFANKLYDFGDSLAFSLINTPCVNKDNLLKEKCDVRCFIKTTFLFIGK